jgi:hypothetical protein
MARIASVVVMLSLMCLVVVANVSADDTRASDTSTIHDNGTLLALNLKFWKDKDKQVEEELLKEVERFKKKLIGMGTVEFSDGSSVSHEIKDKFKYDITKTDSVTTPYKASVVLSIKIDYSNDYSTRRFRAHEHIYGYQDGRWVLLNGYIYGTTERCAEVRTFFTN